MAAIQRMSGQEFANIYNEPPAVSFAERVRRAFGRNRAR
jgi:1-acyl-sn-glycerol-3-phosphate acyltransferase